MAISRRGPTGRDCTNSRQCPGAKGVFISGIRPDSFPTPTAAVSVCAAFSRRGSPGFCASAGISQETPNFRAPAMRPCAQYFCTSLSEISHRSAACRTVMYSMLSPSVTFSHVPKFAAPHTFSPGMCAVRPAFSSRSTRKFRFSGPTEALLSGGRSFCSELRIVILYTFSPFLGKPRQSGT